MKSIDELYSFAYYSLQAGRYEKAQNAFRMLLVVCPSIPVYWLGLLEASLKVNDEKTASESLKVVKQLLNKPSSKKETDYLENCLLHLELKFMKQFLNHNNK